MKNRKRVNKWSPRANQNTPILKAVNVETELELNPILGSEREKHWVAYMVFDLENGASQGFKGKEKWLFWAGALTGQWLLHNVASASTPLTSGAMLKSETTILRGIPGRNQPATLPRVSELVLISRDTFYEIVIRNKEGVTVGDVWKGVFEDRKPRDPADHLMNSLTARGEEIIRRDAMLRDYQDCWLRHRKFFKGLTRDDDYAQMRLQQGFNAINLNTVFLVDFSS